MLDKFNEQEVRDIIEGNLAILSFREAIIDSYYYLAMTQLTKLYADEFESLEKLFENDELKALNGLTRADSYMCLLRGMHPNVKNCTHEKETEHLRDIFGTLRDLAKYLGNHYAQLKSFNFAKSYSLDDLEERQQFFAVRFDAMTNSLRASGRYDFSISPAEVRDWDKFIVESYRAILGTVKFPIFLRNFNKALHILAKYKTITNPSDNEIRV